MTTALASRIILPADPDEAVWLAERSKGMGGSDAPVALGYSRWKSPFEYWLEVTGQLAPKTDFGARANERMRWGELLEPLIVAATGERIDQPVFRPWVRRSPVYQHPDVPFMRTSTDGFVGSFEDPVGCIEAKATAPWVKEWDEDAGELPKAALVQALHEMAVLGLPKVWVAAFVGDLRLAVIPIERDEKQIEDLIWAEQRWWDDHVVGGRPPAPVGTEAERDFLSGLWPASMGEVVTLDWSEFRPLADAKLAAEHDLAEAKLRKTTAEDGLRLLLGPATEGVCDEDLLLTWREQPGKVTPDAALINDRLSVAAMAASVLVDTDGAGSAQEHADAGHVLLEALADCRAGLTHRSDPHRVLLLTKRARTLLGED